MSTPAELECMCKVPVIKEDVISDVAMQLRAKLGSGFPARTDARLCWRALVQEATEELTAMNDVVYVILNRLDDLAAKGVVEKPAAALLLAVRTELCVRHLRGGCAPQALQAFKGELDTLFPASKDYDAPGSRLERSRRNALLEACSGTPVAVQGALRLSSLDDTLDQLADYLDAVDTQLGTPDLTAVQAPAAQVARQSVPAPAEEAGWGGIDDDDDFPFPLDQPATQAPPGHHGGSPPARQPPAPAVHLSPPVAAAKGKSPAAKKPATAAAPPAVPPAAAAAAKAQSPVAKKPVTFLAPAPKPKAAPMSPPVDESAEAQLAWPRVSLAALRRAFPDDDFDALRVGPITATDAKANAVARAQVWRGETNAGPGPAKAPAFLGKQPQRAQTAAPEEDAPAARSRGAVRKGVKPPKRNARQLVDDDDDDHQGLAPPPMQADDEDGAPAAAGTQQGTPRAAAAPAAQPEKRRSPFMQAVDKAMELVRLRAARTTLRETGTDPLAETLAEAAVARRGPGSPSPMRIDPVQRGPTAKTISWSDEKEPAAVPKRRDASGGDLDYMCLDTKSMDDVTEDSGDSDGRPAKKLKRAPPAKKASNVTPSGRRAPTWWSDDEVALLIQLHKAVPATCRQPWAHILKAGGSGFQHGRSTVDLKDKWRNLVKSNAV